MRAGNRSAPSLSSSLKADEKLFWIYDGANSQSENTGNHVLSLMGRIRQLVYNNIYIL